MEEILIILDDGRPKGNTRQLVDSFVQRAIDTGHHVELIALNKITVNGCTDYNACRHGKPSVQKDIFNDLVPKIKKAGLIVFISPLL